MNYDIPDLEELIRRRQDELRGRSEDWIDRLVSWWEHQDWFDLVMSGCLVAIIVLVEVVFLFKVVTS